MSPCHRSFASQLIRFVIAPVVVLMAASLLARPVVSATPAMPLVPAAARTPGAPALAIDVPPGGGFVPNRGQAPPEVLYYASAGGCAVYLTRDAIVVDRGESEPVVAGAAETPSLPGEATSIRRHGQATWFRFAGPGAGASGALSVEPEMPLAARLNFMHGADPAHWQVSVPVYQRVRCPGVANGADLVVACDARGWACELSGAAAPAAAAEASLRMTRDRGDGAAPDEASLADLRSALGVAAASAPGEEIFDNPAELRWSTYLGGTSEESCWSLAVDPAGSPVVTGLTISTFFPTTPGSYDQVYTGLGDVFVSKLSPDGTTLLWSTFLGGSEWNLDFGYAVTLDRSGNPIVTGYTWSADFPTTPGVFSRTFQGFTDCFVAKLDATGSHLLWSTFLGGSDHDIGYALALDASGNVVVAGRTLSTNFPILGPSFDPAPHGEEDGFVTKLLPDAHDLVFSTYFGGTGSDVIRAVGIDAATGEVLLSGSTASPDFYGQATNGADDVFIARLAVRGDSLIWSRVIGGARADYGNDLALDADGNAFICGETASADFPVTAGAYDTHYNGDDDAFVARVRGSDGATLWATFIGGSTPVYETALEVVVDASGRPVIAGATPSADFPTTMTAFDRSQNGRSDAFVAALGADGATLDWSTFAGGSDDDYAYAVGLTPEGRVIIAGSGGKRFPVTAGAYDATYAGDLSDAFVSEFAPELRTSVSPPSAAAGASAAASTGLALRVLPNPCAPGSAGGGGDARVAFRLPAPDGVARLEVFDAAGRLRRAMSLPALAAGEHEVAWPLTDASGHRLAPGLYRVRLSTPHATETRSLVILR